MYDVFLEKYPDHQLAAAARFEIQQLGVPDREILDHLPFTPSKKITRSPASEPADMVNN